MIPVGALFGAAAAAATMGAVLAVTPGSVVRNVYGSLLAALGVSGILLSHGAIVPAGLVLLAHGASAAVMLRAARRPGSSASSPRAARQEVGALAVAAIAAAALWRLLVHAPWPPRQQQAAASVSALGYRLITDYRLAAVLVAALFALAAAIVVVARREPVPGDDP